MMNLSTGPHVAPRLAEMPTGVSPRSPRRPSVNGATSAAPPPELHLPGGGPARPNGDGPAKQPPATRTFAAGELIFNAGSGAGLIYIVRSGCVRLAKALPGGRAISLGLLGPHTIFTQEDTNDGIASGTTAEALVPSTLSVIEASDLADLIAESPELTGAVVTGMTRRLTELQTLIEHLLARDTAVRLATTLLTLADRFGEPVEHEMTALTLPLTHQALANMIGSNRVTVTRKLLEFQTAGLTRSLGRNRLAVNPAGLRACIGSPAAAPQRS